MKYIETFSFVERVSGGLASWGDNRVGTVTLTRRETARRETSCRNPSWCHAPEWQLCLGHRTEGDLLAPSSAGHLRTRGTNCSVISDFVSCRLKLRTSQWLHEQLVAQICSVDLPLAFKIINQTSGDGLCTCNGVVYVAPGFAIVVLCSLHNHEVSGKVHPPGQSTGGD